MCLFTLVNIYIYIYIFFLLYYAVNIDGFQVTSHVNIAADFWSKKEHNISLAEGTHFMGIFLGSKKYFENKF